MPPAELGDPAASSSLAFLCPQCQRARQLYYDNDADRAVATCLELAETNPDHVENLLLLGTLYFSQGKLDSALSWNSSIGSNELLSADDVATVKRFAQGFADIGVQLQQQGIINEKTEHAFRNAVALDPSMVHVKNELGNLLRTLGNVEEAKACYLDVLRQAPNFATGWNNLACVTLGEGALQHAIDYFVRALYFDPYLECTYENLGSVLGVDGSCSALYQLAYSVRDEGRMMESSQLFRRSLLLKPTAEAHAGLASVLHRLTQLQEAVLHYSEAIRLNPSIPECHSNLGYVYRDLGDLQSARKSFLSAVQLNPLSVDDFNNLACICKDLGSIIEAIENYQYALQLMPNNANIFSNLAHSYQMICQWDGYDERMKTLVELVSYQVHNDVFPSVHPHHTFLYPLPNPIRRLIAKAHAVMAQKAIEPLNPQPYDHHSRPPRKGRLRIGYVSSDFKDHPTAHLMQSVPGFHDRANVEVFCYSLAPDDGSFYRAKIAAEAEHFIDLSGVPDNIVAANRIYEDGIHVLVNLNGYTKGARTEIFALRPAPVQVMWLGYPGTSGSDYMDYIITDPVTSPLEHWADQYSEKFVHMPHTFFVGDHQNMFPLRSEEEEDALVAAEETEVPLPARSLALLSSSTLFPGTRGQFSPLLNIPYVHTNYLFNNNPYFQSNPHPLQQFMLPHPPPASFHLTVSPTYFPQFAHSPIPNNNHFSFGFGPLPQQHQLQQPMQSSTNIIQMLPYLYGSMNLQQPLPRPLTTNAPNVMRQHGSLQSSPDLNPLEPRVLIEDGDQQEEVQAMSNLPSPAKIPLAPLTSPSHQYQHHSQQQPQPSPRSPQRGSQNPSVVRNNSGPAPFLESSHLDIAQGRGPLPPQGSLAEPLLMREGPFPQRHKEPHSPSRNSRSFGGGSSFIGAPAPTPVLHPTFQTTPLPPTFVQQGFPQPAFGMPPPCPFPTVTMSYNISRVIVQPSLPIISPLSTNPYAPQIQYAQVPPQGYSVNPFGSTTLPPVVPICHVMPLSDPFSLSQPLPAPSIFSPIPFSLPPPYKEPAHAPLPGPTAGNTLQPPLTRSYYGLPEDKLLFCNFNQLYKIDPNVFRSWVRILKRVPNSAIWLLRFPPAGEANVRRYAEAEGLSPDRIIFTNVAGKIEHVRRGALADMCLDTMTCNGHTTGMDILWAGTPMVTMPGETLASRVASAQLTALGIPELIATSVEEYEEIAVRYASDPTLLREIKRKVRQHRRTFPLFNTRLLTHNLERAFTEVYSLYESNQEPCHVVLTDMEFDRQNKLIAAKRASRRMDDPHLSSHSSSSSPSSNLLSSSSASSSHPVFFPTIASSTPKLNINNTNSNDSTNAGIMNHDDALKESSLTHGVSFPFGSH